MNNSIFEDGEWYNAVTLTERINGLRSYSEHIVDKPVDAVLAERNYRKWKSQRPFNNAEWFDQKLLLNGVSENEFLYLMGESSQVLRKRLQDPPSWLVELEATFSQTDTDFESPEVPNDIPKEPVRDNKSFDSLIMPIVTKGRKRLSEGLSNFSARYKTVPFDNEAVESIFLENLVQTLAYLLNRTLALEVNVARLKEELEGVTPEDRYKNFLASLKSSEASLTLLKEYAVLARQCLIHVNKWVNASLELLNHLCADWEEICKTFCLDQVPGNLVSIELGAGDLHRNGKSVAILEFDSGLKLVYKPRSLSVDVHFQDLLTWLNEKGNHHPFKILSILDRSSHGWMEFAEHRTCTSTTEIHRFYFRQGCFLALLYALEATDFHSENLIAVGEHPVLIDLESLLHPRVKSSQHDQASRSVEQMSYSVLRVGLLPQRLWVEDDGRGVDLSGFGGVATGQMTPYKVPQWENVGTDEVYMVRRQVEMPSTKNRPQIDGIKISTLSYTPDVEAGFTSMYRLLQQHGNELLSEGGPIAKFASDEIRYIARPTRTYSLLLHEAFHPDLLRNGLDRERYFDRLWIGVEKKPYLTRIVNAEIEDLNNGDIPFFSTQPGSCDIFTSRGERIPDFLETSGFELVRERLKTLSNSDMQRQLWFVKASFASLASETDGAMWASYSFHESEGEVGKHELAELAEEVGDRLITLAIKNDQEVSWVGVSLVGKTWSLSPLGLDLYNGVPGIILFFAYLGRQTGNEKYTNIARLAFKTFRSRYETMKEIVSAVGAFDGWGGWVYLLAHLGSIWRDSNLMAEAKEGALKISELLYKDRNFDVIGGAAGAIWAVNFLYCCSPSKELTQVIIRCADHLLAHTAETENGIAWATATSQTPLTGMSHGVAGIAYALSLAYLVSGDARYCDTAFKSLAYERSLFSIEAENWLDLREDKEVSSTSSDIRNNSMTAWCHGAPGIGMARLNSLPALKDLIIEGEIQTAIDTTSSRGFGLNHSLCHGDLGNLDFLLQARQMNPSAENDRQVKRITAIVCRSIKENGWLCGIPLNVESPGLMTGLAGIGYQLLRLSDPLNVPSVLTFEPPKCSRDV